MGYKERKVFVSGFAFEAGLKLIREAGFTVEQWPHKQKIDRATLIEKCKESNALLSVGPNKINKEFLSICSHLEVIALLSVGYDQADIEAASELGIPICNTPGVLSNATADTAFLLMLAASRKAFNQYQKILEGKWKSGVPAPDLGIELYGKTIGIFGLGRIGFEMAKRCKTIYNMKVIYNNRGNNPEAEAELGATKVSFEELLEQSDVLSVHASLSEETKEIFNKSAFHKMKKNAIFINTARGGLHQEKDLIAALQERIIWGAGLDVTNPEPMLPDNPLLSMPTVAVLPHIGSATIETREAMSVLAAKNIIAGLRGEQLLTCINEEELKVNS
jgi:glyoxylate reductase